MATIQDKLPARSGMKGENVLNRERFIAEIEDDDLATKRFEAAKRRFKEQGA